MKSTTLDLLLTISKPTAFTKMSCSVILHITRVTGSPLLIAGVNKSNFANLKREEEEGKEK